MAVHRVRGLVRIRRRPSNPRKRKAEDPGFKSPRIRQFHFIICCFCFPFLTVMFGLEHGFD